MCAIVCFRLEKQRRASSSASGVVTAAVFDRGNGNSSRVHDDEKKQHKPRDAAPKAEALQPSTVLVTKAESQRFAELGFTNAIAKSSLAWKDLGPTYGISPEARLLRIVDIHKIHAQMDGANAEKLQEAEREFVTSLFHRAGLPAPQL